MRVEPVEILSDQTNAAVMRHPGRRFPGVLIQGDTLYSLCQQADRICREAGRASPVYGEVNDLRNKLWALLNHYKSVLGDHEIKLPFSEQFG
jgi:hypothetical protein